MTLISKPLVSRYINRELAQQASNTRRVFLGPVISLNSILPPGDGNISVHHGSIFITHLQSTHEKTKTLRHEMIVLKSKQNIVSVL